MLLSVVVCHALLHSLKLLVSVKADAAAEELLPFSCLYYEELFRNIRFIENELILINHDLFFMNFTSLEIRTVKYFLTVSRIWSYNSLYHL